MGEGSRSASAMQNGPCEIATAPMFTYESIEVINKRLKEHYGLLEDKPNFRLQWPDEEYEIRLLNHTPEGLQLLHPVFKKVHKYLKIYHGFWVLERLTEVDVINQQHLPDTALSYEPIYHFYDLKNGQATAKQPAWPPIKFLIDTLLDNIRQKGIYTRYKHPNAGDTSEDIILKRLEELREMEDYLFGDETNVTTALAHQWGVVVPRNYEKKEG